MAFADPSLQNEGTNNVEIKTVRSKISLSNVLSGVIATSLFSKDENKIGLTKDDIGLPTDFEHRFHLGWNPKDGFETDVHQRQNDFNEVLCANSDFVPVATNLCRKSDKILSKNGIDVMVAVKHELEQRIVQRSLPNGSVKVLPTSPIYSSAQSLEDASVFVENLFSNGPNLPGTSSDNIVKPLPLRPLPVKGVPLKPSQGSYEPTTKKVVVLKPRALPNEKVQLLPHPDGLPATQKPLNEILFNANKPLPQSSKIAKNKTFDLSQQDKHGLSNKSLKSGKTSSEQLVHNVCKASSVSQGHSLKDAEDVLRVAADELSCCICFKTPVEPTLCKDCHQIVGCGLCVNDWISKKSRTCPKCHGSSGFIGVLGLNGFGKMLRELRREIWNLISF